MLQLDIIGLKDCHAMICLGFNLCHVMKFVISGFILSLGLWIMFVTTRISFYCVGYVGILYKSHTFYGNFGRPKKYRSLYQGLRDEGTGYIGVSKPACSPKFRKSTSINKSAICESSAVLYPSKLRMPLAVERWQDLY